MLSQLSQQEPTRRIKLKRRKQQRRGNAKKQRLMEQGRLRRTRKLRLHPTREQQQQIQRNAGIFRAIYNTLVDEQRNGHIASSSITNEHHWQGIVTEAACHADPEREWWLQVPAYVRQKAVSEFFRAWRAAVANIQAGNIAQFRMKFK